ncbi:MAG TPA: hypothetical protein VMD58_07340 [Acidobacteriaceae bacterium]|nr:hypothetical protein [Acidobacteriaceae bacterium]
MSASSRIRLLLAAALIAIAAVSAHAQASFTSMPLDQGFGPLDTSAPSIPVPQLIKEFTTKESQFRAAFDDYTWTRSVKVETINDDGKVDGEYYQVTNISYAPDGRRMEDVEYAPPSTLERIIMTPADFSDIEERLPFVLTTEDAQQYNITYVGKQRIDQIDTYVFNVAPKVIEKRHRYFDGRIWVDQVDHQIVVTDGKNVPDDLRKGHEDLSLPFITYRQQIDGRYWFPVYTHSDGVLHFTAGNGYLSQDVHMRETVKYTNYKRFRSTVRVLFQGQDISNGAPAKNGQQQPQNQTQSQPASNPK